MRFALLLTGDRATAEDVVQDAFLGLHRHWDDVNDPGRVLAYLRTAVVNGARSRYRRHVVARRVVLEPLAMVQSAEASVLAGEERRALLAAVDMLPRRQREVLALKYFLDLGEREIAEVLSISRGAVASTASRALATLARRLREES
jgi:RNA polymerase sigma factor (sigma-70 family)